MAQRQALQVMSCSSCLVHDNPHYCTAHRERVARDPTLGQGKAMAGCPMQRHQTEGLPPQPACCTPVRHTELQLPQRKLTSRAMTDSPDLLFSPFAKTNSPTSLSQYFLQGQGCTKPESSAAGFFFKNMISGINTRNTQDTAFDLQESPFPT